MSLPHGWAASAEDWVRLHALTRRLTRIVNQRRRLDDILREGQPTVWKSDDLPQRMAHLEARVQREASRVTSQVLQAELTQRKKKGSRAIALAS